MAFSDIVVHVIRDVHATFGGRRSQGQILVKLTLILQGRKKLFPDHNSRIVSVIVMKYYGKVQLAWVQCPMVFEGFRSKVKVTEVKT